MPRFICTRPVLHLSPDDPGHSDIAQRQPYTLEAESREHAFIKMCGLFPSDCSILMGRYRVSPRDVFTVDYDLTDSSRFEDIQEEGINFSGFENLDDEDDTVDNVMPIRKVG
jgi:hypothetical protein